MKERNWSLQPVNLLFGRYAAVKRKILLLLKRILCVEISGIIAI